MKKIFSIFIITIFFALCASISFGETLFSDDLNWSGEDFQNSGGWQASNFEKLSSGGIDDSGCMRRYGKGVGAWIDIEGLGNHLELYIRFYAKVVDSSAGTKWIKIFGQRGDGGSTYANTTFNRIYGTGYFDHVSYGASGAARDTTHTLSYNLYGSSFFPSSEWTCYEYHIKFAQGPNWDNGVYEVWVDGVKYMEHTGVDNRGTAHKSLYIDEIAFDGYSQATDAEIGWVYIDEVVVSTERIGETNQKRASLPTPNNLKVVN